MHRFTPVQAVVQAAAHSDSPPNVPAHAAAAARPPAECPQARSPPHNNLPAASPQRAWPRELRAGRRAPGSGRAHRRVVARRGHSGTISLVKGMSPPHQFVLDAAKVIGRSGRAFTAMFKTCPKCYD